MQTHSLRSNVMLLSVLATLASWGVRAQSCGVSATSVNLGGACGNPDPILTITPPVLGETATLLVESEHPNAPVYILYSYGQPTPTTLPGLPCVIHVDVLNPQNYFVLGFMTDSNGEFELTVPIPFLPTIAGLEVTVQARTWFAGGPIPEGDHLTNGVFVRFGCPTARIGDKVYCDLNNDGVQNLNEPGIPGVRVDLECAGAGIVDFRLTDSNGCYLFEQLPSGACTVTVDVSTAPAGKVPGLCPTTFNVNLASGQSYVEADFCFVDAAPGEGCTPGFWKQNQHFQYWPAPYTSSTEFSAIFENAFPGLTLVEVARLGGGGLQALGRHTVAALLNGGSTVNYGLSAAQIIQMFNAVYPGTNSEYETLKNMLAGFNERGCPF